jgi:hypothetical protein
VSPQPEPANYSDESLSHTTVVDPIDRWAFVGTVVMFGLTATFMGSDFPAFVYLVWTVLAATAVASL